MMIHEITEKVGRHKKRKRIGRGRGSGHGKTSGRGHKGAHSRSGWSQKVGMEGGQMPWFRRLPKRGFTNAAFRTRYHVVNLNILENRFDDGTEITPTLLAETRIIRDTALPVKILGEGELTKKFNITAAKFSESAKKKIEDAGGAATMVEFRRKWVRSR